jgi:hypothetical protein
MTNARYGGARVAVRRRRAGHRDKKLKRLPHLPS